jgi:hypothetical protein
MSMPSKWSKADATVNLRPAGLPDLQYDEEPPLALSRRRLTDFLSYRSNSTRRTIRLFPQPPDRPSLCPGASF